MKFIPTDPDIETLVSRIRSGKLSLQPNFQRGEVWPLSKKQKLIDSILRNWHIPPIHVIDATGNGVQEVLDGQQRLTAIRDFMEDDFSIDGYIEPYDEQIMALDRLRWSDLGDHWKGTINNFPIRVFRLTDYRADEPWELFFRLNQSTKLTGAEERNAFFGPVRDQIKMAVSGLEDKGLDSKFLGFNNSRMAYDDMLSRTALAIERRTLARKITASDLASLYRSSEPLSMETISRLELATTRLGRAHEYQRTSIRLNKASVFSWLMFLVRGSWRDGSDLMTSTFIEFFHMFEEQRSRQKYSGSLPTGHQELRRGMLTFFYEDRSTSRVADISSVLLRDAVLWMFYKDFAEATATQIPLQPAKLEQLNYAFNDAHIHQDDLIARRLLESDWGSLP